MSFGWQLFFTIWCGALTGLSFCFVSVIGTLGRKVNELEFKATLHEEFIMKLSNELVMCIDYLNDNCMFCMYNMDPDREEENKE